MLSTDGDQRRNAGPCTGFQIGDVEGWSGEQTVTLNAPNGSAPAKVVPSCALDLLVRLSVQIISKEGGHMAGISRDITIQDVQDLLGRALVDSDFRRELLSDPEGTFTVLGMKMTTDSMNFFRALNDATFLAAADSVENRLGGRPVVGLWF